MRSLHPSACNVDGNGPWDPKGQAMDALHYQLPNEPEFEGEAALHGMVEAVALQRVTCELERVAAGLRPANARHGHGAVQGDDGRGIQLGQVVVEFQGVRPVGRGFIRRTQWPAAMPACRCYSLKWSPVEARAR